MTVAGETADVVVIGGGLAGISAAIELAGAGRAVTMLESRPWLGGATCSFARRGLTIDNGQHAYLRHCTAYRELLATLGVTSSCSIQDGLDLTVLSPHGQAQLRRSALPAPLQLARSLASYRLLSPAERARAALASAALWFGDLGGRTDRSFGDWLARHGQNEQARQLLWELLSMLAVNIGVDDADLGLAASAIEAAVLAGRDNADLGLPAVPLSKLHGEPAAALLGRLGARIRMGTPVTAVRPDPAGGYEIGLGHGNSAAAGPEPALRTSAVVLAVPAWEAAALAPPELAAAAAGWSALVPSPIVSIHVIYASRVTRLACAAAVDSPLHWVVDKTVPAGLHAGQYLAASVRAARRYVDQSAAQLRAELLPAFEQLFPAAAQTEPEDFFVTRERRATIAHTPGSQRLRPSAASGLPRLVLAGAWTDTGWPDSMEGAVRSGQTAARQLLAELGSEPAMAGGSPDGRSADGGPADLDPAELPMLPA
jgi:squalene-associated FAD-dependent desaturase